MTTDEPPRRFAYQEVMATLRDRIASGELAAQLPSAPRLAQELGVGKGAVERAYDELKAEGLIESVPGLGTFVKKA